MRLALATFALVLSSTALSGQQKIAWHPDNMANQGLGNAFPWGSNGIRYQTIVPGSKLGRASLIQDVFVAGRSKDFEIIYDDIEIRMGRTSLATVTTDWKKNNPNPTTVYRGPLRVRFEVGKWHGIGLPVPYRFLGVGAAKNLCFEVIVWKTRHTQANFYFPLADAQTRRAFRFRWTGSQTRPPLVGGSANKMGLLLGNGNFVAVGTGCASSASRPLEIGASTYPQAGKSLNVTLKGAKGPGVAVLMVGASFTKLGAIALPFDLAPLGAPKCFVWNDLLVVIPAVIKPDGSASTPFAIPPTTGNARLYMHWWARDPAANRFGWATSSSGKMLLGN